MKSTDAAKVQALLSKPKQGDKEVTETDHIVVDEINFSVRNVTVPIPLLPKKVI